jgi:hypothetical protein
MSQALYPNIITNTQRNANVGLQGSTLMGGNLAQVFNLQALKTLKGRVIANGTATNPVINEYDGSPLTLGTGDFVIALTIANGNPTPDGSAIPYAPTALTQGTVRFYTANVAPTYANGVWTALFGSNLQAITAATSYTVANSIGIVPVTMATPAAAGQWVSCTSAGPILPAGDNFVHVTMLVINSQLAQ